MSPPFGLYTRPCISRPRTNMITTEPMSSRPRPQRFWIRCPAPGMSQPIAGASTAIDDICVAGAGATASLLTGESAISDDYDLVLNSTSYLGALAAHQHVHFAAYTELRQVHAWLNRKTTVRQNAALVVDLQVVHISAVGVNLCADGMSGPVNEVVAVSGFGNALPHRIIHLIARNLLACSDGILHELNSGVARLAHNFENFPRAVRRRGANEARPCDVVIHSIRRVLLRPNIEQNEVAFTDRQRVLAVWTIVRVTAVRIHRDHGSIAGDQILAVK